MEFIIYCKWYYIVWPRRYERFLSSFELLWMASAHGMELLLLPNNQWVLNRLMSGFDRIVAWNGLAAFGRSLPWRESVS